ncbi:UNVERIFIED_ORG: hypothetical protein QOE_3090 [Clostridioides difficile F501]
METTWEMMTRNVESAWERRWKRARSSRLSMVLHAMET